MHILPNVIDSAIVQGTLEMAGAILSEASLTFLGLGVPPSIATWGGMVATGRQYIFNAWWLTAIPGLFIFLVCLSICTACMTASPRSRWRRGRCRRLRAL